MLLPASRLETKSLTFISKPVASECSYENDFFGGETPDELSECLDGSVGMLQDLEQVRFYVVLLVEDDAYYIIILCMLYVCIHCSRFFTLWDTLNHCRTGKMPYESLSNFLHLRMPVLW